MKRLGNILLIAAGLAVGFLICEIVLRIAGLSYPVLYTYDERGGALLPGAEGWRMKEGKSYIRINSDGLRDREHAIPKPANSLRIAVLGDSYAEAMQVNIENTFWSILERELSQCDKFRAKQFEAINFGVAGYGTARELITLRNRVWKYDPDIVLLAFLAGNDIRNNSKLLENDPSIPYFVLRDGELVLDDSYLTNDQYLFFSSKFIKFVTSIINKSYTLQLLNEARYKIKLRTIIENQNNTQAQATKTEAAGNNKNNHNTGVKQGQEKGLTDSIYTEPKTEAWKNAWDITERLILKMNEEILEKDSKFLVVTLSNGIQVHPDPSVRLATMHHFGVNDLFYADNRIRILCEKHRIPVLNLVPAMQKYAEEKNVFLHGFKNTELGTGHWNENGHRIAGELIADKICADATF